jgi:hypothetical protein
VDFDRSVSALRFIARRAQFLLISSDGDYLSALSGEENRRRTSDSAARTCHDNYFSGHILSWRILVFFAV